MKTVLSKQLTRQSLKYIYLVLHCSVRSGDQDGAERKLMHEEKGEKGIEFTV